MTPAPAAVTADDEAGVRFLDEPGRGKRRVSTISP